MKGVKVRTHNESLLRQPAAARTGLELCHVHRLMLYEPCDGQNERSLWGSHQAKLG